MIQSSSNGEKVLDLLMIAKYFERMGDHAVEIAKWVIFSITGHKEAKFRELLQLSCSYAMMN